MVHLGNSFIVSPGRRLGGGGGGGGAESFLSDDV